MNKIRSQQPWSIPVQITEIAPEGTHIDIIADEATRAGVARAAGLRDLLRFEASFDLFPYRGDGLHVLGRVIGTAGQSCVVTLEPMVSEIDEAVDLLFVPGASDLRAGEDKPENPEPLLDGRVDLGAIATEFLILGIDPYPRRPGAVFESPLGLETSANPFAQLATLKTKSGGNRG